MSPPESVLSMARRLALGLASLMLLLWGCASYQPRAHLIPGPDSLGLTLYVNPLEDRTPPENSPASPEPRLSLTEHIKTDEALADYLRRAVMVEFTSSQLFRSLAVEQGRAEVTISGVIHAFYGATRHASWVRMPGGRLLARLFNAGLVGWEGAIDLELTLSDHAGRPLGTYRGQRRYEEAAATPSTTGTPSLSPAERRFDDAFTDVLEDLRDQILRDRERILGAIRTTGTSPPTAPTDSRRTGGH